jgi:hypothetical protein
MSLFGGPEACKRVVDLELSIIKLEARVKSLRCTDIDVLNAITSARAWLTSGWAQRDNINKQVAMDAWSNRNIKLANYACVRGNLFVSRGNTLLDAIYTTV